MRRLVEVAGGLSVSCSCNHGVSSAAGRAREMNQPRATSPPMAANRWNAGAAGSN